MIYEEDYLYRTKKIETKVKLKMETDDGEYFNCYAERPSDGKWIALRGWFINAYINYKGPYWRAQQAFETPGTYDPIF